MSVISLDPRLTRAEISLPHSVRGNLDSWRSQEAMLGIMNGTVSLVWTLTHTEHCLKPSNCVRAWSLPTWSREQHRMDAGLYCGIRKCFSAVSPGQSGALPHTVVLHTLLSVGRKHWCLGWAGVVALRWSINQSWVWAVLSSCPAPQRWLCCPLFLSSQMPKCAISDVWVEQELALQCPAAIQPGRSLIVNTSQDSRHWQTLHLLVNEDTINRYFLMLLEGSSVYSKVITYLSGSDEGAP